MVAKTEEFGPADIRFPQDGGRDKILTISFWITKNDKENTEVEKIFNSVSVRE